MHPLCSKCLIFTYQSACQLSSLRITGMAAERSCTWLIRQDALCMLLV